MVKPLLRALSLRRLYHVNPIKATSFKGTLGRHSVERLARRHRRAPIHLQPAIALEARVHLFDYMVPVVKYLFSIVVAPFIGFAWARNELGKRSREFMAVT